jgi:hypothetical protein
MSLLFVTHCSTIYQIVVSYCYNFLFLVGMPIVHLAAEAPEVPLPTVLLLIVDDVLICSKFLMAKDKLCILKLKLQLD